MTMKSKAPLTPQEMQLRSARSRWSKFTKKERSEAMKRLRQSALAKTSSGTNKANLFQESDPSQVIVPEKQKSVKRPSPYVEIPPKP
jgi:predicted Fe-S protein YdhL (DUF1289 family)